MTQKSGNTDVLCAYNGIGQTNLRGIFNEPVRNVYRIPIEGADAFHMCICSHEKYKEKGEIAAQNWELPLSSIPEHMQNKLGCIFTEDSHRLV